MLRIYCERMHSNEPVHPLGWAVNRRVDRDRVAGRSPWLGCQSNAAQSGSHDPRLDQEFVLRGGQEVNIRGTDLRLHFTDVLEDSRCPKQVECFWTGQARIADQSQSRGQGATTTLEFNTNPAPGPGPC